MAKHKRYCGGCQFFYQASEGDTIFPDIDPDTEGFCRVLPPRNRGGKVVVDSMYPIVRKDLPACGEYNRGRQDW